MKNEELKLSQKQMQKLGYDIVDILVSHVENISKKPVSTTISKNDAEAILKEPLPKKGSKPEDVLSIITEHVFANAMHLDHPRFFGWVSSPSNYVSVMADLLSSGFNTFSGIWMLSGGPAQVELTTIDWLKEIMGMPEAAGGLFVSGGSVANLTALTVARNIKLKNETENAVIYLSDQTHSSNERALKIIGFKPHQIRRIPTDKSFRINLRLLNAAIRKDKKQGKKPFCVIANAGSTNTGSIDPLEKLHKICKQESMWLHVDGAFGAAAILDKNAKKEIKGIKLADSLTVDPHKWLFQPYEIGCILIRNAEWLKETFYILPEYLKDTERGAEEVNFCNRGVQLTRGFRALKLWMSIKVFGIDAFKRAVSHGIKMAELAEEEILKLQNWEIVSSAKLGIVTFRYLPLDKKINSDWINKQIAEDLIKDKYAILSTTSLNGHVVLRLCSINPRTTPKDIENTIWKVHEIACKIEGLSPYKYRKLNYLMEATSNELEGIKNRLSTFVELGDQVKEVKSATE